MKKYWALLVLGIYKSHGHSTFFEDLHVIIHSMCPYQFCHNSEWLRGHMSKLIWSLFDLSTNDLLILFSLVIHSCHKLQWFHLWIIELHNDFDTTESFGTLSILLFSLPILLGPHWFLRQFSSHFLLLYHIHLGLSFKVDLDFFLTF